MSYDVSLVYRMDAREEVAQVSQHQEGGTYAMFGTKEARLNVTYNYARVYGLLDFSIRELDGRRAGDLTIQLAQLVEKLGTNKYTKPREIFHREPNAFGSRHIDIEKTYAPENQQWDYWAPTPGNAGHALDVLLGWAREHPNAYFRVEA